MLSPLPQTDAAWCPPEDDVRPAYQPVEVLLEAPDTWAVGRINAWWHDPEGRLWCRLRLLGATTGSRWHRYDPEQILLLPTVGT
ncbi:hypothetical protein [Kitasatospora sp. NPDC088134]|uniref:hypothetical protein n=1 Tax=Kitasatospora sp. NPDC088134 TaxID=3364071 RepID=UPI0038066CA8